MVEGGWWEVGAAWRRGPLGSAPAAAPGGQGCAGARRAGNWASVREGGVQKEGRGLRGSRPPSPPRGRHPQLQHVRVHRGEVLRRRPQPLQRRQQREDAQPRRAGRGDPLLEAPAQLRDWGGKGVMRVACVECRVLSNARVSHAACWAGVFRRGPEPRRQLDAPQRRSPTGRRLRPRRPQPPAPRAPAGRRGATHRLPAPAVSAPRRSPAGSARPAQ